jgi:diguanylate cyclase (GGDEF)-like protein
VVATAALQRHNAALLDSMNALTTALEHKSHAETMRLRVVQSSAFGLALLNFLFIVLTLWRGWRSTDRHRCDLEDLVQQLGAGILILDEQDRVRNANLAARELLGKDEGQIVGRSLTALLPRRDGLHVVELPDGRRLVEVIRSRVALSAGEARVATLLDATARHQKESQLEQLALHDALTGAPNRRLFDLRLADGLREAAASTRLLGLVIVDLDGFKPINDCHGHHTGDLLLRAVAARLEQQVREGDTVARLGGDEFAVLIRRLSAPPDLDGAIARLAECFATAFQVEDREIAVQASLGGASYPRDGDDAATLIQAADRRMYASKPRKAV